MPSHFFDTQVATEFGMVEALLINHFQFWIAHNRANKANQRQGRTWTYNSVKALQELLPYLGVKQIRNGLKRLEDRGVLLVDNYNQTPYDRTLWYAFADEDRWLGLPKSRIGKKAADNCPNGKPIPDKSPTQKADKEGGGEAAAPAVVARASEHEGVAWPWETETFWEAWASWREYKRAKHKFTYATLKTEQAALNKLRALSGDSEALAHAIIAQSLERQWEGFYELKTHANGTTNAPGATSTADTERPVKAGTSAARTNALANWGARPADPSPPVQAAPQGGPR